MKTKHSRWKLNVLVIPSAAILLASSTFAATASRIHQLAPGKKAKVSGVILFRDGGLVRIRDKRSDHIAVNISSDTQIVRKKHKFPFYRHADMDMTALLPGLTIEAEGVADSDGQLNASKISFTPDDFAIEVAQQQQVLANKAAVQNAQSSADQAANAATQAQSSADQAQNSADQADQTAVAAGRLAVINAAATDAVNQRVSDMESNQNALELVILFPEGSSVLNKAAKRELAKVADAAKSVDGYMIEISGYAAHYKFSLQQDQKISEDRAAAVTRYLLEAQNVPMIRILAPVAYGASQPIASNTDARGRALNRRVTVRVLTNNRADAGM